MPIVNLNHFSITLPWIQYFCFFFLREHRVDDSGRQCKNINFEEGTINLFD